MKTANDIEQWLKPQAEYHASPSVRERVMAEAAKTTAPKHGNNLKWWWMGIAASLLIVAGVILQTLPHTSHDRAESNHHQSSTNSPTVRLTIPSSVEEPKQDIPLIAQVTESPKPHKQEKRKPATSVQHAQSVTHETVAQEPLLEEKEESEVDFAENNDEQERILAEMQPSHPKMSEEEEYMHMNVRVFTANIRIRNKQDSN